MPAYVQHRTAYICLLQYNKGLQDETKTLIKQDILSIIG